MEENTGPLLHSTPTHASLKLPQATTSTTAAVSFPVIDVSLLRDEARRAVLALAAVRDIGFFQVVNHGVPAERTRAIMELGSKFFGLPASEPAKAALLSGSATVTIDRPSSSSAPAAAQPPPPPETVVLRLKRRAKKKVSWKEGTVGNESLGRKSSKKCCIFHKEVPFDEDCSDDDDRNPPADGGGGCSSSSPRAWPQP